MKRMLWRVTASAIASASMKSFLFDLRYGFTNCAGISFASCPWSRNLAARKCAPEQASMPMNDHGRLAVNASSCERRLKRRRQSLGEQGIVAQFHLASTEYR